MSQTHATLLQNAGRLLRDGPVDAAIAAHHLLLQAYPDNPDAWYNLALLERRARRSAASVAALDKALACGISGAEEVWLQRGLVLSDDMGDIDGAKVALTKALAIAPRYVPALLNMGNLEEDIGNRAAAEDWYRTALKVVPSDPLVLARLAGVAELTGAGDPLLDQLRSALRRGPGHPLAEADLGFALGTALDRTGDYDGAFDAYVAANRASSRFAAGQGQRYDRAVQEKWIDRLIAGFPAPVRDGGEDSPLFICGMVRSGSTLLERMLSRHQALVAGGERDSIPSIAAGMPFYPEVLGKLSAEERGRLAARYRAEAGHRQEGGGWLIDKRPDNIAHLGLIRAIFPDARIIRTVRAPLDNLLSAFFLHADPMLCWATDLGDIAHYLTQERRLAAHARAVLGTAMHEVGYERLVNDTRGVMENLLAFCGLEWSDDVLDPTGARGAVKTASVWQVREPVHQRSCERWRHYAHRLGGLPAQLEDMA